MGRCVKTAIWIFWITSLLCCVCNCATPVQTLVGPSDLTACREQNVTFRWEIPENVTSYMFVEFVFMSKVVGNDTNARETILSLRADGTTSYNTRYKGRLKWLPRKSSYGFQLESINPKDRGTYEISIFSRLEVDGPLSKYMGAAHLVVYAEDNLWPQGDASAAQAPAAVDQPLDHRYSFFKHEESPVTDMAMSVEGHPEIRHICYFANTSRCNIMFSAEEFEGLSGTLRFIVKPQTEDNKVTCDAVPVTYDYTVTIVRPPLTSALIGGICVSVFIAVAACVIPPIIICIKKKRDSYLPLKGGYDFMKGCVDRLEATPDMSDVYRKNANNKVLHSHAQGYFQDSKTREDFFEDDSLTKIYFAACIKHYIKFVREPLITLDYINKIKSEDNDESLCIEEAKSVFTIRKNDSRSTKERKRIVKILFQHFHWFRERKIEKDGSDSEERSPTKILTTTGLSGFMAMNFDRTNAEINYEEFDKLARLTRYLRSLIVNADEVFGRRDPVNGNVKDNLMFVSLDTTSDSLLETSDSNV